MSREVCGCCPYFVISYCELHGKPVGKNDGICNAMKKKKGNSK